MKALNVNNGGIALPVRGPFRFKNLKIKRRKIMYNLIAIYYLKRMATFLKKNRKTISTHMKNLGVSGYTGSYVYLITNGFNGVFVALLVSGVLFTLLADKLSK